MEVIEFLKKTERKNIQTFIETKVKEKLLEYDKNLNERRQKLNNVLEFENIQYSEELVLLAQEKLNDQFKKRLDWVNTKCMERMQAEAELLKLKNQQRELENCEAWRLYQSKQLLLDSKKGQLYQIEDKKLRSENEKQINLIWHDLMQRLNNEKEYQEMYKNKLLKVIERTNQLKNREIDKNNKKQLEQENQQTKKDFQEENQKALYLEEMYRNDAKRKEFLNRVQQNQTLKSQITSNYQKKTFETQQLLKEARLKNEQEDRRGFLELEQSERKKYFNNELQNCYLENTIKEKQRRSEEENECERMYLNTGCVLQQSPKKPYGKSTR